MNPKELIRILTHLPALPSGVQKIARSLQQAQHDISADDEMVARVAGLLRHNPEEWQYLYQDHPVRRRAEEGIRDLIPYLPDDAIILVHLHEKWCLVAFDEYVYPAILKSTLQGSHLYRIIAGKSARWLPVLRDDVKAVVEQAKYVDGVTSSSLASISQGSDAVSRLTGAGLRL
jgi:hypothetical protein